MTDKVIHVAAAVIVRDGKILIGQRPKGEWGEFEWEFPGGKLEPGEDPPGALQRELREELAIEATIGEELDRYEHQYAGTPRVLLVFHLVKEFAGEPQNLAFEQIKWEAPEALPAYPFLKGDVAFVDALSRGDYATQLNSTPA
ncbi:MAG: (deoxy)nucleoside triphosphate pyrophosphohydrolase [Bryobacterales bacterium]|nr:(deoxy)nucleoside triphosphate pyrophosphohydrolase [Bryobacterales bacterium]